MNVDVHRTRVYTNFHDKGFRLIYVLTDFYFNCTAVLVVKYQTRISTAVLNLLLQSTKNIMNESCSVSGYAEHGAEHTHGAGHGAGRARAGPRMIMRMSA